MSSINFNFSPTRAAFSPVSSVTNSIENVTGIFDKIMGIAILVIFAVLLLIIFIFGPGEPIPQYGIPPGRKVGKIYKGEVFQKYHTFLVQRIRCLRRKNRQKLVDILLKCKKCGHRQYVRFIY